MASSTNAAAKQERAVRRRNLARGIDLAWDGLRTHLSDAVHSNSGKGGNEEFEARSVREYSEMIYTMSVELHELAKQDFQIKYQSFKGRI